LRVTARQAASVAALLLACSVATLRAQEPPAGIKLAGIYNVQRPLLAVRAIESVADARVADTITQMLRRDVRYSERYITLDAIPEKLATGAVDYAPWNELNLVYLVTGSVQQRGAGYELALTIHDVVWRRPLHEQTYLLPAAAAPDFRLAVHAIADEIGSRTLQHSFGAASRIAYVQRRPLRAVADRQRRLRCDTVGQWRAADLLAGLVAGLEADPVPALER
jgi:hypothetical protein